jgi:hypothetical protein
MAAAIPHSSDRAFRGSKGVFTPFPGPDADRVFQGKYKKLAVADSAGTDCFQQ